MHVRRNNVHATGNGLPRRANEGDLCHGREQLPVRQCHGDLRGPNDLLRRGARSHVLAHVHGQLHARSERLRIGRPVGMHTRNERMLGVRARGVVRSAPELHRGGWHRRVHVQDRPRLL